MPEGLENVHLGMPIKELIATRKNIKSGTTFNYCFNFGRLPFCKWYKDPNDPKRLDITLHEFPGFNSHLFKENYDFLFFDTVWFSCSSRDFDVLIIDGGINTRKKRREYPKKRDEFILYAIKKWGRPDQLLVGDEKFSGTGRHDYYSITMNWRKGGTIIHAEFPLAVEEYFKSLSMTEKSLNALRNIADNYPEVRIKIEPSKFTPGTFPYIYMPRRIVNKEETDKLLKSIGFDKLLKRAMAAAPSIMPGGMETVYFDMPIKDPVSARKNIKSGIAFDYWFSYGRIFCKWYKNPNNPKRLDQSVNSHMVKENCDFLFFDTVWFSCLSSDFDTIGMFGGINTRKKLREFPKKRDEFILYAIKKWGKPDQLLIGDEKVTRTGRHDYYSITMNWRKGGTIIHAEFPLAVDEYFKSISMTGKLTFHDMAIYYPETIIKMQFRGFDAYPSRDIYKPRRLVNKEETDKLLKSIGFDELLKRATTK